MTVGQRPATVNGQTVMLEQPAVHPRFDDVRAAAFRLRGAPGRRCGFDNGSKTVHIYSAQGGSHPQPVPTQTAPPQTYSVELQDKQPRPGSVVRSVNPPIAANFSRNVDPNSIRFRWTDAR